jgi:hypothetical protein
MTDDIFEDLEIAESLLSSCEVEQPVAADRFTARTLAEVAQFFGVQPQTVRAWRLESPPMPGSEGRWPLPEIVRWKHAKIVQTDAAQAQRNEQLETTKLKNEKLRIEIAVKNGKWVDRAQVEHTMAIVCSRARTRLENLPYNVAMLVPSDCKAGVIQSVAEVIRLTLKELSETILSEKETADE